jgi:hypothetical protein
VAAGAAVEAVGQRGLTSKTQIEVIARAFNWLVWLLGALNMLQEAEVRLQLAVCCVLGELRKEVPACLLKHCCGSTQAAATQQ